MLNKLSIRWKLLTYMTGFALIMLILLGLYQSLFMETVFKMSKRRELDLVFSDIRPKLMDKNLQDQLERISEEQNICILVTDMEINIRSSSGQSANCLIHKMSADELIQLKNRALSAGGKIYDIISSNQSGGLVDSKSRRLVMVIIYNGNVIFMDSSVKPPQITQDFTRAGLIYAALSFLFLTAVLIHLLSKGIINPVKQLSNDVRSVAMGDYSACFHAKGCREIELLSDALNYMITEINQVEMQRIHMIANISHDIRTPLAAIIGYGELMRDFPREYSKEKLQAIIDEANWLSNLVTNLLQISRMQENIDNLVFSRFDITLEIEQILLRHRNMKQKEGYILSFDSREHIVVEADRIRISQVIYNLVNNGIQHAGTEKIVTVKQVREKEWARISVHNSGDFIPEEDLPYIWERYYRGRPVTEQKNEGWGLGLFIVRNILELHHAQYGVDSRRDIGTTFWFRIPIERIK